MNQVQNISFHFLGEEEAFFRSLYTNWDIQWIPLIEKSVNRILEKYNDRSLIISFDSLTLDMGTINQSDFKASFLPLFEEHLENELLKKLYQTPDSENNIRKSTILHSLPELLFYFLIHGTFPWHASLSNKNINKLFLEVAKNNSTELLKFLQTFGHYTSLQKRLVFQLDDQSLTEGIKLLKPGESHFIISYIRFLHSKYQKTTVATIPQTSYRTVIWHIIYSWLLTNRSSFFNKKSFLQQTIQQLASNYRITYSELLRMLLAESAWMDNYLSELFILLKTLYFENNQGIKNKLPYWEVLRELMILIKNNKTETSDRSEVKTKLIDLLTTVKSTRYLKLLQEKEILEILQILVPQHYTFIKTYASALEKHTEKGMLQGKAGDEFRIIKWQIMFSLFLDKKTSGFNRHHFVLGVLQRIAAHYNITVGALLKFVCESDNLQYIDAELHSIFRELYLQYNTDDKPLAKESFTIDTDQIIQQLKTVNWLNSQQQKQWKNYLLSQSITKHLIERISEKEYHQLIRILYPAESEFVISYSKTINQQHTGELQGKTSGNFSTIKRYFILAVLQEFRNQGFNKKYFIEKVLQKLAARYNVKKAELVRLFYDNIQKNDNGLPFELLKILKILYFETLPVIPVDKGNTIKMKDQEKDFAQELLIQYLGTSKAHPLLIKRICLQAEFVIFIESILQIQMKINNFLSDQWMIIIDKKKVLLILLRFSTNYTRFSKAEILIKLISWIFTQLKTPQQQSALKKYLQSLPLTENVWREVMSLSIGYSDRSLNEEQLPQFSSEENLLDTNTQSVSFISNAGVILLAPFLPRLFSILQLTEKGKFISGETQIKAMFLIQYAVFGTMEFSEHKLHLNKLLTGFKTAVPIPRSVSITEEETKTIQEMLVGVVQHWNKVKTIDGLREGFLQREGKLHEKAEDIELTIESKPFDMLLDTLPWNFRTIRFSWMEKTIQVKWR